MDKFARYYAWFLLFATGLPALARLLQARQLAVLTSERMSSERQRSRYRLLGWGSVLLSLALIPVYLWWSHQLWLPVATAIGVLTGLEMVGNTKSPAPPSLERQNRIYGVLYAISTVGIYFILIHK